MKTNKKIKEQITMEQWENYNEPIKTPFHLINENNTKPMKTKDQYNIEDNIFTECIDLSKLSNLPDGSYTIDELLEAQKNLSKHLLN